MAKFEIGDKVAVVTKTPGSPISTCKELYIGYRGVITQRVLVAVPEFYCQEMRRNRSKKFLYTVDNNWHFYYEDLRRVEDMPEYAVCKVAKTNRAKTLSVLAFKRAGACNSRLGELMGFLVKHHIDFTKSAMPIPFYLLMEFVKESDIEWLVAKKFLEPVANLKSFDVEIERVQRADSVIFTVEARDETEAEQKALEDAKRWEDWDTYDTDYETIDVCENDI